MYLRDPAYRECIKVAASNLDVPKHPATIHTKPSLFLKTPEPQQAVTRPVPLKQEACPRNTG
jgi:hypothetical protein